MSFVFRVVCSEPQRSASENQSSTKFQNEQPQRAENHFPVAESVTFGDRFLAPKAPIDWCQQLY